MFTAVARGRAINTFQRAEILGLAHASQVQASAEAVRAHYTRVGEWLPAGVGGRVLEVGCGPGRYVALLAAMGYDVVGVDPFEFPLWAEIAKIRPVAFHSGIKAESLPFPDASFDHVTCISAMLYFDDPDAALAEMRRVLKPGGRLYLRTVNRNNMSRRWRRLDIDPAAKNYFDESSLHDLLARHEFDVERIFSYGFFPPIFKNFWWYLCNGPIPIALQEWISELTPPDLRVSVVAFASLPNAPGSAR